MSIGVIQLQKQFVDALKIPKSKIESFDGNAVDYFQFICESESSIGKYWLVSTLDEREKLNRLIQHFAYVSRLHLQNKGKITNSWSGPIQQYIISQQYIGSPLLQYLKVQDLIRLGLQVVHGMEYMESKGWIHRQLAVYNCMISKVSQIGVNTWPDHSRLRISDEIRTSGCSWYGVYGIKGMDSQTAGCLQLHDQQGK